MLPAGLPRPLLVALGCVVLSSLAPLAPRVSSQAPASGAAVAREPAIVWITSGEFERGSDEDDLRLGVALCVAHVAGVGAASFCPLDAFLDESPRRRIRVSAFGIDRTEVSRAAYGRCVAAGRCAPPRSSPADPRIGLDAHPVTGVDWAEALAFCGFAGGRLPTEAEWERAARGPDGRPFPWGRHYDPRLANHGNGRYQSDASDGFEHASPVGAFPAGASVYGVLDLSGNAWEWTADAAVESGYAGLARVDPRRDERTGYRIVRGGSWRSPPHALRVTHRVAIAEGARTPDLGFRCAYDR